jgi:hypothetical protein
MATRHQHETDHDRDDVDDDMGMSEYILPPEKGRELFDEAARHWMGISGEEFLRRWDSGEYRNVPDTPAGWRIMHVRGLMSFARQDP